MSTADEPKKEKKLKKKKKCKEKRKPSRDTDNLDAPIIKDSKVVKLKSKKKLLLIFLFMLILLLLILFFYPKLDKNNNKEEIPLVSMPLVIGKTSEEATETLKKLGLEIEYIYEEVDGEDVGKVTNQSVSEKKKVKEGTLVELTVTVSKKKVIVVNVVGLNDVDAINKLQDLELKTTVTEQYSDTVEVGKVISQMPIEGEMVYKNSIVEVLISLGPEPTVTPEATPIPTKTPVVKNWSNWVTSLPSHVNKNNYYIETKTEYRYQDKETTTSTNPNLSGWTQYNEEVSYSDWGTNKTTTNSITESDTVKIVSSQKKYTYYHWKNWYDGMWNVDSIKWGSNSTYCEFSTVFICFPHFPQKDTLLPNLLPHLPQKFVISILLTYY